MGKKIPFLGLIKSVNIVRVLGARFCTLERAVRTMEGRNAGQKPRVYN